MIGPFVFFQMCSKVTTGVAIQFTIDIGFEHLQHYYSVKLIYGHLEEAICRSGSMEMGCSQPHQSHQPSL